MEKPIIIAHRGSSAAAPENTMPSFIKAMEMGAGGIELDVQMTADGYLVVIHDERVERTSNGTGWVKDKTLAELRTLDFGGWFSPEYRNEKIPVLNEVLEAVAGWDGLLNIEVKNGPIFYPGIEKKVADMVRRYGLTGRTIVSCFNHYSLVEIKKDVPEIKTGILYVAGLYKPWEYAKKLEAYALHPLFYNIVPEIVKGCKENGIVINPYTVDQPEFIKKLALAGVDGIITNVPDVALHLLDSL